MLGAAGVSVTGPGHVSLGQANQDAIALRGWRGGWIAAVADGLGSRPLSGLGSRLAVQAAQQTIRSMPNSPPWASSTTNTGRSATGVGMARAMAHSTSAFNTEPNRRPLITTKEYYGKSHRRVSSTGYKYKN